MTTLTRPSINLSRNFAKLIGLEVRGRGPFYIADSRDHEDKWTLAYNLSADQVADYLEAHDVAQLQASGPCCLIRTWFK